MTRESVLFSADEVMGVLGGRKTQFRRVVKPQPDQNAEEGGVMFTSNGFMRVRASRGRNARAAGRLNFHNFSCPYGQPGDSLWVKETFGCGRDFYPHYTYVYRVDFPTPDDLDGIRAEAGDDWRWQSSVHMPKQASRITLVVLSVRVQRLQAITDEDAVAEGATRRGDLWSMDWSKCGSWSRYASASPIKGKDYARLVEADVGLGSARFAFANYWDKINGKRLPWSSNPFVWAIGFKRM